MIKNRLHFCASATVSGMCISTGPVAGDPFPAFGIHFLTVTVSYMELVPNPPHIEGADPSVPW